MKKLIPYILSYLIVATGTIAFSHFSRHANPFPPNSVTVITTLSHDELAAKLNQAGLSESHIQTMTVKSDPLLSLVLHFVFFGIYFAAFAGLTYFFQRVFRANVLNREHNI
jgi:hypothetical protein